MSEIWADVDANVTVLVNIAALIDDTDFKTREESMVFNQAGLDLVWNFVTTAGVITQTAVTPTDTGGDYDWTNVGNGMYKIELPASGGVSANNDTEGFGYFTGFATGILPWRSPIIGFRAVALNNALIDGGDVLDVNLTELGGVSQSATDLKDFADAGYDPGTNKVQGVVLVDTTTTNTDMVGTANALLAASAPTNFSSMSISAGGLVDILQTAADKVWSTTTRALTDKVGFALSSAGVQAIWDALTSALTTAGSIGKLLVDNINTTISSRSSHAAAAIWAVATRTLTAGTKDTEIDAIKAKTDNLPSDPASETSVNANETKIDTLITRIPSEVAQKSHLVNGTGDITPPTDIGIWDALGNGTKSISGLNDLSAAQVNTEMDTAIGDARLDELIAATAGAVKPVVGSITDQQMNKDGSQTFSQATDSSEGIRDRGDAAWITGGGGGITQIINFTPTIPLSIDLANTSTVRLGMMLINSVDDLPSTAEITPGTISIERKAIGGTSWSLIVTNAVMSEIAGMVYYDEVFNSGSGYAEGDSLRITMKNVSITADANTFELIGATGVFFQTSIRQTMRGNDDAATATALATHDGKLDTVDTVVDSIKVDTAAILVDTNETQGKLPTNNIMGSSVKTDKDDEIDTIKAKTDALPNGIKKNTALNNFSFFMVDSTDHITGKTGLTITAERSIDGAAYTAAANSTTEIGVGTYKINLATTDLNGDVITLKLSASGADTRIITIITQA